MLTAYDVAAGGGVAVLKQDLPVGNFLMDIKKGETVKLEAINIGLTTCILSVKGREGIVMVDREQFERAINSNENPS